MSTLLFNSMPKYANAQNYVSFKKNEPTKLECDLSNHFYPLLIDGVSFLILENP